MYDKDNNENSNIGELGRRGSILDAGRVEKQSGGSERSHKAIKLVALLE